MEDFIKEKELIEVEPEPTFEDIMSNITEIQTEWNKPQEQEPMPELTPEQIAEMERLSKPTYEQLVVSKIRSKYSLEQELAINRQRDTKPQEFKEYFDYCEQCKADARKEIL